MDSASATTSSEAVVGMKRIKYAIIAISIAVALVVAVVVSWFAFRRASRDTSGGDMSNVTSTHRH